MLTKSDMNLITNYEKDLKDPVSQVHFSLPEGGVMKMNYYCLVIKHTSEFWATLHNAWLPVCVSAHVNWLHHLATLSETSTWYKWYDSNLGGLFKNLRPVKEHQIESGLFRVELMNVKVKYVCLEKTHMLTKFQLDQTCASWESDHQFSNDRQKSHR